MGIPAFLAIVATGVVVALATSEVGLRFAALKLRPLTEWQSWEMHHKVVALNDLASEGGASVVAVGSSMVNAAVDPELLSRLLDRTRPAFNGALNGAGIRLLELWTLRIILPRLRPDIVVIGLGSHELNSGNKVAQRLLDALRTSAAWRDLVGEGPLADRLVRWAEKRSFLVRYRRYLGRSTLVRDTPTRRFTTCRRLGTLRALLLFRFKSYSIEEQQVRTWKELLNNYEVGSEEMAAFGRLIDGLRAAGVTPIIVQMPVTNDWLDLHPAGRRDFERFEKAMDSIAHQRDVPDVDLMAPFLSIEEFADPVHLNGEGQARFTNLLADVIAELPTPARA